MRLEPGNSVSEPGNSGGEMAVDTESIQKRISQIESDVKHMNQMIDDNLNIDGEAEVKQRENDEGPVEGADDEDDLESVKFQDASDEEFGQHDDTLDEILLGSNTDKDNYSKDVEEKEKDFSHESILQDDIVTAINTAQADFVNGVNSVSTNEHDIADHEEEKPIIAEENHSNTNININEDDTSIPASESITNIENKIEGQILSNRTANETDSISSEFQNINEDNGSSNINNSENDESANNSDDDASVKTGNIDSKIENITIDTGKDYESKAKNIVEDKTTHSVASEKLEGEFETSSQAESLGSDHKEIFDKPTVGKLHESVEEVVPDIKPQTIIPTVKKSESIVNTEPQTAIVKEAKQEQEQEQEQEQDEWEEISDTDDDEEIKQKDHIMEKENHIVGNTSLDNPIQNTPVSMLVRENIQEATNEMINMEDKIILPKHNANKFVASNNNTNSNSDNVGVSNLLHPSNQDDSINNSSRRKTTNPFRVISVTSPTGSTSRISSHNNSRISSTNSDRKYSTSESINNTMGPDNIAKLQARHEYLINKCTKLTKEINYLTKMNSSNNMPLEDGKKLSAALVKLQEYLDQKTKEKYEVGVLLSRQLRRQIDRGENGEFWIGTK